MPWETRNLNLLNIDDQPPLGVAGLGAFVSLRPIRDLDDASKMLIAMRNRRNAFSIDMLLCDVNMEDAVKNDCSADVLWAVEDKDEMVPAYGPLLALPFASTNPWCQIVPISNYWGSNNVKLNGYVLSALALIMSVIDGTPRTMMDAMDQIPKWEAARGEVNIRTMLRKYIPRLRDAILEKRAEGRVTIWGVDNTIDRLNQWKLHAKHSNFRERLPITLGLAPICLELIDEDTKEIHFIHISSLFADRMDFAPPRSAGVIDEIIEELEERWSAVSFKLSVRSPYQAAQKALFPFMPGVPNEDAKKTAHWLPQTPALGSPLKRKLVEEYKLVPNSEEFFFAVRLAILFAWARAWYLVRVGDLRHDLHQLVYHFLGCDRFSTPSVDYKRLLGTDREFGTTQYTMPFRAIESCIKANGRYDILKGYSLDNEDPDIALSEYEKILCAHYVESTELFCREDDEKIFWEEKSRPSWMA